MAATMKPAAPPVRRVHDERRQDLVGAAQRRRGHVLVVREEHHADDEEQRELREDDDAAEHEAEARLARGPRGQQALHEELVGAVRGQRQRDAADEPGPERVDAPSGPSRSSARRTSPPRIPSRRPRPIRRECARSSAKNTRPRAGDVHEHLHDVGPDHGRRAAADRVDDHRAAEQDHRPRHRHAGDHGDDERRREQPDAVGERARDQEDAGRRRLHRRAEPALQQLVRRDQLAAEVRGNEDER